MRRNARSIHQLRRQIFQMQHDFFIMTQNDKKKSKKPLKWAKKNLKRVGL